jgi:hypothetical protein
MLLTTTDFSSCEDTEPIESFVIKMQAGLSIISYREIWTETNFILPKALKNQKGPA